MNKLGGIFLILMLSVITMGSKEGIIKKNEVGKVFYTPFHLDLYAGIPESKIERLSHCISEIRHNDFFKLINKVDKVYTMNNVRVKIVFADKTYFINEAGIVTDFKETFKLKDKDAFEKAIRNSLAINPKNPQELGFCKRG